MNALAAGLGHHRRSFCFSNQTHSRCWPAGRHQPAAAAAAACVRRRRPGVVEVAAQHSFVLYTKPECPLCDGLKDKLQALLDRAQFMQCSLTGSSLEVRDISTNEAWQDAMHLSVPVLAVVDESGQEVMLPRPPPRITADRLQRHLEEALQATSSSSSS